MPAPFWLYRCGIEQWSGNGFRYISTETWLSLQPEIPGFDHPVELFGVANRLNFFWGFGAGVPTYAGVILIDRLWPRPGVARRFGYGSFPATSQLNANAPEAAFRLQRVGASGAIGRLMLPILDDSVFTDLPHRRHIDLATWTPRLNHGGFAWPQSFVAPSTRTYTNVIFHRASGTWTPVTSYALLVNPIRRWARWRTKPRLPANSPLLNTSPNEIEEF